MNPANESGDFGARSGAVGSLASANGTSATVVAKGILNATRSPDATFGKSEPVSVARSLSSGHLNLSQPTGSWASAGAAIAQAMRTVIANLMARVLIDRDHDVGRLDDGDGGAAHLEAELVDRFIGDRRGDDLPRRDLEADVSGRGALLHVDNFAFELIACADFHGRSFRRSFNNVRRAYAPRER